MNLNIKRLLGVLTLLSCVLAISIALAFRAYRFEIRESPERQVMSNFNPTLLTNDASINATAMPTAINLIIRCTNLNTKNKWLQADMNIVPTGSLSTVDQNGVLSLKDSSVTSGLSPLHLVFGSFQQQALESDKMTSPLSLLIPTLSGTDDFYPFDVYRLEFFIFGYFGSNEQDSPAVPIGLFFDGSMQGFKAAATLNVQNGSNVLRRKQLVVNIVVERTATTKFFAMFVIVIMWAVTFLLLTLVVDTFVHHRTVTPIIPMTCTGFLFALSGIRSSAPYVPSEAVAMDILGYFFCMSIVAVCFVLTIVLSILQKETDSKKLAIEREEAMTVSKENRDGIHPKLK